MCVAVLWQMNQDSKPPVKKEDPGQVEVKKVQPKPKPEPKAKPKPTERDAVAAPKPAPVRRKKAPRRKRRPARLLPPESPPLAAPLSAPEQAVILTAPDPGEGSDDPLGPASDFYVVGSIFDLNTLAPVAEADVILTDSVSGNQFRTTTDQNGSYQATVPASGRYDVKVRKSGYDPKNIPDPTGALRKASAKERTQAAADAGRALEDKLISARAGTELTRDYAIIPSAW